ncbi:translation initiation factor IF-2-like [Aquila chrysaetos chrysaetos]|uniref:translation initiation factor IF-2-like n=1 Tax=Aquila chrysaetos chrysaetos TaxID=223781 RepID=UPI001176685F|nr:translation initiation factor IF-2-like [Aquila chrysaetos chrysaetos]
MAAALGNEAPPRSAAPPPPPRPPQGAPLPAAPRRRAPAPTPRRRAERPARLRASPSLRCYRQPARRRPGRAQLGLAQPALSPVPPPLHSPGDPRTPLDVPRQELLPGRKLLLTSNRPAGSKPTQRRWAGWRPGCASIAIATPRSSAPAGRYRHMRASGEKKGRRMCGATDGREFPPILFTTLAVTGRGVGAHAPGVCGHAVPAFAWRQAGSELGGLRQALRRMRGDPSLIAASLHRGGGRSCPRVCVAQGVRLPGRLKTIGC